MAFLKVTSNQTKLNCKSVRLRSRQTQTQTNIKTDIGLKTREGRGVPRAGRSVLRDFRRAKPEGNPEEQPCQSEENLVLPNSFTHIYTLFLIGFRIGPPKMHNWFRIGLPKIHRTFCISPPKIHRRFRIGPPQVTFNLLLPEFHSR